VALKDELEQAVSKIIRESWTERDGEVVPEPEDLKLGNDAVNLQATVVYADMSSSTKLVDSHRPTRAAEVYKAYMVCAAQLIKFHGGTVTAYDGDRVMGVFIGDAKNSSAAKAALRINWALQSIVNPANKRVYGDNAYELKHVVGIDTSPILACRIGVRNDNDIVWVGRAANYAAKLTEINEQHSIYITDRVFDRLNDQSKYGGVPLQLMWEKRSWANMNDMIIYRSNWHWGL
jgi:class 3 adenylate cyclase